MPKQLGLFANGDLNDHLRTITPRMLEAIDAHPTELILSTPVENLVESFVQQFRMSPVVLNVEGTEATEPKEMRINVSGDRRYDFESNNVPVFTPGITVTFHIPFTGDRALLSMKPSHSHLQRVRGVVGHKSLDFEIQVVEADRSTIRPEFVRQLQLTQAMVAWSGADVAAFNATLPHSAQERIEARRERLLRHQSLANELGVPIRSKKK